MPTNVHKVLYLSFLRQTCLCGLHTQPGDGNLDEGGRVGGRGGKGEEGEEEGGRGREERREGEGGGGRGEGGREKGINP